MKLHELKASSPKKSRKRRGRGTATGIGKTSGRGENGQNSRSGGGTRPGFEGGQMPLYRRIPKRGFNNHFRIKFVTVNVEKLNDFDGEVTIKELIEKKIIKNDKLPLKILGNGELKKALTVKANRFTKSAMEKITSAGGKYEEIE